MEEKRRLAAALQRWCVWERGGMSGCRYRRSAVAFDFGEGFDAAFADLWITGVFAHVGRVVPAAVAFGTVGAVDLDGKARQGFGWSRGRDGGRMDFDLGNDEERWEKGLFFFEKSLQANGFRSGVKMDFCFEASADGLCGACLFEGYENSGANLRQALPFFGGVFADSAGERFGFREQSHVDAFGLAGSFRQILPDFLGGENENRRYETDERAADFPDGGLRGAAYFVFGSFGVQAILQHVEIEGAEIHYAIIVNGVVDAVEFVAGIPFAAFLDEFGGAVEHPTVEFLELIVRKGVARGIEITKVAEREAKRVADFSVGFAELRHYALAHLYVGLVFDGADPKAEEIGAPLFANFNGVERIAERFGHRAALLVERPAVGDDAAIGRSVAHARGNEQRAVEPAAVLIGAFEIDIGRPLSAL